MGNRAVVCWQDSDGRLDEKDIGVYLHWNGGRDSIEAFLAYCEACGFRSPSEDDYGVARFVQVVANFFGADGLSIGVNRLDRLDCDNGDNGLYVCKGWKIVDRKHFDGEEQMEHDPFEMLNAVNDRQPADLQLGEECLRRIANRLYSSVTNASPIFAPEDL